MLIRRKNDNPVVDDDIGIVDEVELAAVEEDIEIADELELTAADSDDVILAKRVTGNEKDWYYVDPEGKTHVIEAYSYMALDKNTPDVQSWAWDWMVVTEDLVIDNFAFVSTDVNLIVPDGGMYVIITGIYIPI